MTSKDANHESEFAKSTRELLSALRKEIECPVCLSELEQPCSLPCNHFYCRECVERALQLNNGDCPLCKAKFTKRNIMDDAALLEFVHSFRELYSELEKHSALNLEPLSSDQKLSDVSKFRFKPLERTNKDNDVVNWVPRPRSAPVKLSNSIDQNEIQTTTKNPEIQDFAVPQGNSLLNTSQESRVSVDFVDEEKPILVKLIHLFMFF